MIKKIQIISISCLLYLNMFAVHALDLPFEGNEEEWKAFCVQEDLAADDRNQCTEFLKFLSSDSTKIEDDISVIEKEIAAVEHNIELMMEKISRYEEDIAKISSQIASLTDIINDREKDIIELNTEIRKNEQEVKNLNEKIVNRMLSIQKVMRFNANLDFLMGAQSFEDLIIRANGLKAMEGYDESIKEQLKNLLEKLDKNKIDLEYEKNLLVVDREVYENSKLAIDDLKSQAEATKQEYMLMKADLEEKGNKLAGNLDSIKETIKLLANSIHEIPTSDGFERPIIGGFLSAGTWAYPDGGLHLGADYASNVGTPIRAATNGYIIYSTDGCGYGYLGNTCQGNPAGTRGGGNQVYMMGVVDDKVYSFKYLHMLKTTPIAAGSIVTAGDVIGQIGSSGNSSGPHVHVEMVYLGDGKLYDYVEDWDGTLHFGAQLGYKALDYICENGVGAPCRVRPEKYLGT